MSRNAVWCLSNLCRGKNPPPDFAKVLKLITNCNIKGIFQTPERFGQMVKRGYPMVWRPADVQFLEQRDADGFRYQKVLFKDAAGGLTVLEYEMLKIGDSWQINGVQRLQDPPVAA